MHAGKLVNWESIEFAPNFTHYGVAIGVSWFAEMSRLERSRAGRAEMIVGNNLQDFCGAKFPHPALAGEGKMIVFKSFEDTGRARVKRFRSWRGGLRTRMARGRGLRNTVDSIYSHV